MAAAVTLALAGCTGGAQPAEEEAADPVRVVVISRIPATEPQLSQPCSG
jgi:hypothetical protein